MTHAHTFDEYGLCFECDKPLEIDIWKMESESVEKELAARQRAHKRAEKKAQQMGIINRYSNRWVER